MIRTPESEMQYMKRKQGRIEGYLLADSQWNAEYGPGDPLSRANRDEAADAVDTEWPEDKP